MKTTDLIDQLASQVAGPVRLRPVWKKTLAALAGTAVLGLAVLLVFFPLRADLAGEGRFIAGGLALLAIWVLLAWALSLLVTPGRKTGGALGAAAIVIALMAAGLLVQAVQGQATAPMGEGLRTTGVRCCLSVLVLSFLPGVTLFFWLRRGASTHLVLTGVVIGLFCAALGALELQFSCANSHPIHLLIWHIVLPFAVLAGAGALMARRVLRW